jgi:cyanophycinase
MVAAPGVQAIERRGHGYRSWQIGNPGDVRPVTKGGAFLGGGASDRANGWRWFLDHAGYGDIVIIRATGDEAYDPYVMQLGPVDSVQTLKLTKRVATTDPFVLQSIERADGIFLAGGDQSDYVRIWKDSLVEDAINAAIARDVPIGGISAGLAVLGGFAFSAEKNTVVSEKALLNPYGNKITLQRGFLRVPNLLGTITDSHFMARERMGRLLTFLARIVTDGWASEVRGLGIDEDTAVLVEADGTARVIGQGAAWLVRLRDVDVDRCEAGAPLATHAVDVLAVHPGDDLDLSTLTGDGRWHTVRAVDGSVEWDV